MDALPLIVSAFVFLLVAGLVLASVRVIPAGQHLVVFRLGAYTAVREPGLALLIPLLDRGVAVDMRTQTRTIESLDLLLSDRSHLRASVEYVFRVVDAVASVMNVAQPEQALQQLVATTLKTLAASQSPGDFWIQRATMEKEIIPRTREAVENWGIELERVAVARARGNLS